MHAVILAGGKGERLAVRSGGLPKPLVDVLGKPMIERQIELLAHHHMEEVTVLTGFGAEAIARFCGDGSRWSVRLCCIAEPAPLGTAGAVIAALNRLPERFCVLYGDTVLNVDLPRLMAAHRNSGAGATLFLHPNDHPYDSDLVEIDGVGRIVAFYPYPHPSGALLPNLVNAALYVVEADILWGLPVPRQPLDFAKHVFPQLLRQGVRLQSYRSPEYIKDGGTPERLGRIAADIAAGTVRRSSLEHARGGVFLDRDGTINEDISYIRSPEQLSVLPGVAEALRLLHGAEYRIAVITNQPVVARGECTDEDLGRIHNHLETQLGRSGAFLDAIYYCPHHPDRGFAGEVPKLKIRCDCRKPGTGLVQRAVADLNIDLGESWFIGDTSVDIATAANANIRSILVKTGHAGRDGGHEGEPDFQFPNLLRSAQFIVEVYPTLSAETATVAEHIRPGWVVLVGGQARSGKSTFAKLLQLALGARGIGCAIVSLDGWIREAEKRDKAEGFRGRHDIAAAAAAVGHTRGSPGVHHLPRYDRLRRGRAARDGRIEVTADKVLIVEGVTALVAPEIGAMGNLRIAVTCDEALRQKRLAADYRARGFGETAIADLLMDRLDDEYGLVRQGDDTADCTVRIAWAD